MYRLILKCHIAFAFVICTYGCSPPDRGYTIINESPTFASLESNRQAHLEWIDKHGNKEKTYTLGTGNIENSGVSYVLTDKGDVGLRVGVLLSIFPTVLPEQAEGDWIEHPTGDTDVNYVIFSGKDGELRVVIETAPG